MNKKIKYELSFNLGGRKSGTVHRKDFQKLKCLLKTVLEDSCFRIVTEEDVTYSGPRGIKVKQVA